MSTTSQLQVVLLKKALTASEIRKIIHSSQYLLGKYVKKRIRFVHFVSSMSAYRKGLAYRRCNNYLMGTLFFFSVLQGYEGKDYQGTYFFQDPIFCPIQIASITDL